VDVSNSELPWVAAVDTAPEQPDAPSTAVSATTAAAAKRRLGEFANERTVRSFEPEVGTFPTKAVPPVPAPHATFEDPVNCRVARPP